MQIVAFLCLQSLVTDFHLDLSVFITYLQTHKSALRNACYILSNAWQRKIVLCNACSLKLPSLQTHMHRCVLLGTGCPLHLKCQTYSLLMCVVTCIFKSNLVPWYQLEPCGRTNRVCNMTTVHLQRWKRYPIKRTCKGAQHDFVPSVSSIYRVTLT